MDVKKQQIDFLSLSAHKFHGPKGVGALVARKDIPLLSIIEGGGPGTGAGGPERKTYRRLWGMAEALEAACRHQEENGQKMAALRDRLTQGLLQIPHSVLNGDAEKGGLPGHVNVCFEGIEGESLLLLLDEKGICASSGSACTSGSLEPSHVLLAIGRPHEIAHGSLRLTLSEETTPQEIDYTVEAVTQVVQYLRGMSPVWRDLVNGKQPFVIQ